MNNWCAPLLKDIPEECFQSLVESMPRRIKGKSQPTVSSEWTVFEMEKIVDQILMRLFQNSLFANNFYIFLT